MKTEEIKKHKENIDYLLNELQPDISKLSMVLVGFERISKLIRGLTKAEGKDVSDNNRLSFISFNLEYSANAINTFVAQARERLDTAEKGLEMIKKLI